MSSNEEHARGFWSERWTAGQIGFHEGAPNALLVAHVASVETKPGARIFVPLSGKSFDLRWLAERGHEVVGVEFVESAVTAFFAEWQVTPERKQLGGMPAYSARGVTLAVGDFFEAKPEAFGTFDVVYDRAALVAIEPPLRSRYVETCRALLAPGGTTFLITFAYDQAKAPGPPFSVDDAEVHRLFAPRAATLLATRPAPTSPRLAAAGVPSFDERAYSIA